MPRRYIHKRHPIQRLKESGTLSPEQIEAFDELHVACYSLNRHDYVPSAPADKISGGQPRGTQLRAAARFRRMHEVWVRAVGEDASMILEIIEGSVPLTSLAPKYGMRYCTVRKRLLSALDRWTAVRRMNGPEGATD